jgi:hypothetical protein
LNKPQNLSDDHPGSVARLLSRVTDVLSVMKPEEVSTLMLSDLEMFQELERLTALLAAAHRSEKYAAEEGQGPKQSNLNAPS